jgi:hypothetical protein
MEENNTSIRSRLISWEMLRLIYNTLMLLFGVPIAISLYTDIQELHPHHDILKHNFDIARVIVNCIIFGMLANLCYNLGPMLEIYITAFTSKKVGRKFRYTIFTLGTLLSLGLQLTIWLLVSVFIAFELA